MAINWKNRKTKVFASLLACMIFVWLFVLSFHSLLGFLSYHFQGIFQLRNICSVNLFRSRLEVCATERKVAESQERFWARVSHENRLLADQFPSGTEISVFKAKMQEKGARELAVGYDTKTGEKMKRMAFDLKLTEVGLGPTYITASYDDNGKLISPPTVMIPIDDTY